MTEGLPDFSAVSRTNLDGAICFLQHKGSQRRLDNNISHMEVTADFATMVKTAQAAERKRMQMTKAERHRKRLEEPQAYLVDSLQQYIPGLPQKAEKTLQRDLGLTNVRPRSNAVRPRSNGTGSRVPGTGGRVPSTSM